MLDEIKTYFEIGVFILGGIIVGALLLIGVCAFAAVVSVPIALVMIFAVIIAVLAIPVSVVQAIFGHHHHREEPEGQDNEMDRFKTRRIVTQEERSRRKCPYPRNEGLEKEWEPRDGS